MCAATLAELQEIQGSNWITTTEKCIRKTAANSYELYDVREPDPSKTIKAKEACDAVRRSVLDISEANIKRPGFMTQNQDKPEVGRHNQTCRTDFEPFAPLPEEKDWYASEVRDWAITTCTDINTHCRCYTSYSKSGYQDGVRSKQIDHSPCLLCKNNTCQLVELE